MYVFVEWLCRIVLRRRVVVYTVAGKITYRRPKGTTVGEYQTLVNNWLVAQRPTQKLGDGVHGVIVKSEEIIAVEVY